MFFIGLDIGTTSCKAALFDREGRLITASGAEYGIDIPQPGWAEQDPEHVWLIAQDVLGKLVSRVPGAPIVALGLSVQGEAVMPVDDRGHALRPAILGMDTRTVDENHWLEEHLGRDELYEHTGMPVHTINTLPKLLWLKQHERDTWNAADQFLLYEDFLVRKMTGQASISRCLASRTQLFDLRKGSWSDRVLDTLELDAERLARVVPSGCVAGVMRRELADRIGLAAPPLVVTGGHDQACGALGVGLVRPGRAMVSTGTAEVVEVVLSAPTVNPALGRGKISVYAHVVDGLFLAMTLNHSGGLLLRWLRDTFCTDLIGRAGDTGGDAYNLMLRDTADEPSPLLLLPHFAGSGTPEMDSRSKGAVLGLTFSTTRSDLALAVLEGLTFELRLNLDVLKKGGVTVDELRAIGGGARSARWLQLKADVTGLPVHVPEVTEAACRGAALLAAAGAGTLHDVVEASEQAVRFTSTYRRRDDRYEPRYELYRELYPTLTPILHRL